jgi:hypothetical protein
MPAACSGTGSALSNRRDRHRQAAHGARGAEKSAVCNAAVAVLRACRAQPHYRVMPALLGTVAGLANDGRWQE